MNLSGYYEFEGVK